MRSKKEIKLEFKERRKPAGVFQVKNTANGKVFLGSSLNLEGVFNGCRFRLSLGSHPNRGLQREWNEYGPGAFSFDILEEIKIKDDPDFNIGDELTLLEEIWIEKLRPFGEKGYNTGTKIRQV